ncbi:VOC family protein [Acidisoma sp. S159]|uniref:VOC family protein n=1 Tax=Acidisoma sp. S159 TaxID=1747225 RepID=UPI00131BB20D|nr:VOC family protein [Acidisoma sp. S159]
MRTAVQSLARVSFTVSDLNKLTRFYCDALGFSCLDEGPVPLSQLRVLGLEGPANRARLQLGEQTLELLCPATPGRAYPANSGATDIWFQHIAIVVNNMDAAYSRVCDYPITHISVDGPQRLPPSTGRVRAFKFRDPDGHPLELIAFPSGTGDARWHQESTYSAFLGVDHSAIVVRNARRSLAFYESLGFSVLSRTLNQGPEQDRLDGTPAVSVDVIGLRPGDASTPHVELLAYQRPPVSPWSRPLRTSDLASARLVLTAPDLFAHAAEPGHEGCAVLRHDPDGHALLFE